MPTATPPTHLRPKRQSTLASPARIAGAYILFGLMWIWLSDYTLAWAGIQGDLGFWVSSSKGTMYVLLSGLLVFWIARREFLAVARSHSLLRAIVDEATDAIFVKDRKGRYLLFNEAASRFVGKPIDAVLGKDDTELFDPAGARLVRERDRSVMAVGRAETREEELTAAGMTRTYQATKAPYRGENGEILGLIGISRDVSDLKQVEKQLRAERDRFEKIMEAVPVVICSFQQGADGVVRFPYASPQIERIYGIGPEQLARDATPIFQLMHPDDRIRVRLSIEESARSLSLWKAEFRVQSPRLGEIWIEGCSSPVRMPDGSTLWHGYIADVTERKRIDEELKEAHRFTKHVADIVPSALYVFDLTTQSAVYANRTAEATFGYSSEVTDSQTLDMTAVMHPDDLPAAEAYLRRAAGLADGEISQLEYRMKLGDGTWAWFDCRNAVFARSADGTPTQLIGTATDITERKRAEDELRASEERFRTLVDHATDGIFLHSEQGIVVDVNRAGCEALGYQREELIGLHPIQFDPNATEETSVRLSAELGGGNLVSLDSVHRRKDGTTFPVEVRIRPFSSAGRRYGLSVVRDITERKRAEDELRAERDRLAKLASSAPGVLHSFRLRADGSRHFPYVSPAVRDVFGCTPDDLERNANLIRDLIHPDDLPRHVAGLEESARTGARFDSECRARHPSRGEIWVKFQMAPIQEEDGGTVWHGFILDVTERRLEEQKLRESEEWLRLAYDAADLGIFRNDLAAGVISTDARAQSHYGFPSATTTISEVIGRAHPDDRDRITKEMANAYAPEGTGRAVSEYRVILPDGQIRWLAVQIRILFEGVGAARRPTLAYGVCQDVTERKRSEAALRASEERFRTLVDHATDAIFLSTADGIVVDVNRAACEALGYDRSELIGVHPMVFDPALGSDSGDGARFELDNEDTIAFDSVYRRKDGSTFPVEARIRPFRIGEEQFGLAVVRDITDRKRAEDELRAERDRLAKLASSAPGVLHSFRLRADGSRHFPYVSPSVRDLFGCTPDDLERNPNLIRDLIHPADLPRHVAALAESARALTPLETEFRARHPSRGEIWVKSQTAPIREPDGGTVWHGFVFDVTERRLEEQRLRTSEERLRLALAAGRLGTWEWDLPTDAVFWSPEAYSVMGIAASQFGGTRDDFAALVVPEDRESLWARVADALEPGGPPFSHEFRVTRPDGQVRWMMNEAEPVRDSAGKAIRLIGVVADITDRKHAESAIRESEARYRTLVEVLPSSVFVHDGERLTYCNTALVRLMGARSPDELLGLSPYQIAHPDHHADVRNRMATMSQVGEPVAGMEMRIVRLDGRPVPVHSVATPILEQGARGYLVALSDLSERERSTNLLRTVMGSVNDAILTIDERGIIATSNPATERMFGYSESELTGNNVQILMPSPHSDEHDSYIANYLRTGTAKVIGIGRELEALRKDGTKFPIELTVTEFWLDGNRHFTGVVRDITARRRLEDQFRQAQKMEAVGRLAGGVAHDFNNLLTVINGFSDLVLMTMPGDDENRSAVLSIRDAGERAAGLTSQLLAFSRKAIVSPRVLDLKEVVAHSEKLLRRLIGEDITLSVTSHPAPCRIEADPTQLDQVIINLAVNARDAIPRGGRLNIETNRIQIPRAESTDSGEIRVGWYVELTVSDSGCGMSEEVKSKLFEPFFTTKGQGKGTGLGLAVVHGVVKQANGHIFVESEVGRGTTFRILFPEAAAPAPASVAEEAETFEPGTETIVLVEDEDSVRHLCRIALESRGYTVLPAANGKAALELIGGFSGAIDLLVTDVVMPEMSGRELVDAARKVFPALRILFMSGYTDDSVVRHGVREATDAFLQKPFGPLALAKKVRELLDEER